MQDSYSELIKLLPEIIIDISNLLPIKKGRTSSILKEINSIRISSKNKISKGFFDEITVQISN
jgi:hypothetical protein